MRAFVRLPRLVCGGKLCYTAGMNTNYQLLTDRCIASLTGRPSLLLHSCCGPCSSYVLEYLTQYFDVTVLYYNPNIRPQAEYEKRLYWLRRVLEGMGLAESVPLIAEPWRAEDFSSAVTGLEAEPEGGKRCGICIGLRMEETARRARDAGFACFCTTLSVSPHKNAALINTLGAQLEAKYGVTWLPSDFKKRGGFLRSTQICKELGIYRQGWCGCTPREPDETQSL